MNGSKGRVGAVTGAASGIGRASAIALSADGVRVALGDVRDDGEDVAAEIRDAGGEAFFRRCDVRVTSDVETLVDAAVERWGRLDVMFNNVGVAMPGSAADMSEEDFVAVLDVNLVGEWRGMRAALRHMLRQGSGSIINTSSVQGHVGFVGWAAYAASKGGIDALTRQAAVEYGARGVRINSVVPGTIMTPMNEQILERAEDPNEVKAGWKAMHPIGRVGRPEEVAQAVVFLASERASFITGEALRVDGGMIVRA